MARLNNLWPTERLLCFAKFHSLPPLIRGGRLWKPPPPNKVGGGKLPTKWESVSLSFAERGSSTKYIRLAEPPLSGTPPRWAGDCDLVGANHAEGPAI